MMTMQPTRPQPRGERERREERRGEEVNLNRILPRSTWRAAVLCVCSKFQFYLPRYTSPVMDKLSVRTSFRTETVPLWGSLSLYPNSLRRGKGKMFTKPRQKNTPSFPDNVDMFIAHTLLGIYCIRNTIDLGNDSSGEDPVRGGNLSRPIPPHALPTRT